MRTSLIIALAVIWLCATANADKQLKRMQELGEKSQDRVIHLGTDRYNTLVKAPRNYSVLLHLTATQSKFNCGPCLSVANEVASFANSVHAHYGGFSSAAFLEKPLFVVQLEPDDAMEVFKSLELTTVPHLIYLPPTKKQTVIKDSNYLKNAQMPLLNAEQIINFVKTKSGVHIPLYKSFFDKYSWIALVVVTAFLASRIISVFWHRRHDRTLWFGFAIVIYFIVMAGMVFNYLRSPPMMDVDRNTGQAKLISPNGRSQYVAEGFIVASLLTALGLLLVFITDGLHDYKQVWSQRASFIVAGTAFITCLLMINNIFAQKFGMQAFRVGIPLLHR